MEIRLESEGDYVKTEDFLYFYDMTVEELSKIIANAKNGKFTHEGVKYNFRELKPIPKAKPKPVIVEQPRIKGRPKNMPVGFSIRDIVLVKEKIKRGTIKRYYINDEPYTIEDLSVKYNVRYNFMVRVLSEVDSCTINGDLLKLGTMLYDLVHHDKKMKSFYGLTMQEVAETSGFSNQTCVRYFENNYYLNTGYRIVRSKN